MDLMEAIRARHSVRVYSETPISDAQAAALNADIEAYNRQSGLHIQLLLNEPEAFTGMLAKYGSFRNVRNYIALVGKKAPDFEEKCGYYGEKLVLKAQQLGLGTCWVAMTYNKRKCKAVVSEGETVGIVISIGPIGIDGKVRKTKSIEQLSRVTGDMPDFFRRGMEAVQLAPTAVNQQKFLFTLDGDQVHVSPGKGFETKIDMGIAKCHFEIGAGEGDWHFSK